MSGASPAQALPPGSTTNQSCETQLRDLREYMTARGWQATEYLDVVLRDGRVRDVGSSDELMARSAEFRALAATAAM